MPDDRQLVKGLHRGETAALRQVYLKYKDDLITIARSLVGDANTAEDCLQDVFVALASNRNRIRGNLKAYLLRAVVNRARDHLRKSSARSHRHANVMTPRGDGADPAQVLGEDDEIRTVIRVLENLPDEQREIIVLHLQGDMRFREIARILGVSINTVQSRYRYGLERLRQLLRMKEAI